MAPASAAAVIVGVDMISPLGADLGGSWERAAAGESGIGPITRFEPPVERFPVRVAGEAPPIDAAQFEFLTAKELKQWSSPVFAMAQVVVHRALQDAGIAIDAGLAPRTAITFGTAVGGVDALLQGDRRLVAEGKLPGPFMNPNSCVNMVTGKVSMLSGATGPIVCPVAACATGAASLATGALLIETGRADLAICGAVDAIVVDTLLAGFATMFGAFQSRKADDRAAGDPRLASRPLSRDRKGFVVSEGAACLLLCSRDFAHAHGLRPRAELAGWSMTSDARHFVAPHLPTVRRCMEQAIASAGIAPEDVDLINAHAASTKVGDAVECEAIHAVFGQRAASLPVSANKSQTGHAMGASSGIETVFAVLGMERGLALPTINHLPDPELELDCVSEGARSLQAEHVLKNALGFGGANCCLLLRRPS